jgi:hypothetical protein
MVANEARDSFTDIMNRSPLTTSQNEENTAENRWDSEGGSSGEQKALATSHWEELIIPVFTSTEQAISWGAHLNAKQHTTLVKTQRALSKNALAERNMQRMVDLATRSQLLREAAEAFVSPARDAI